MIRRGSTQQVCPVCRTDREAIYEVFSCGKVASLKIQGKLYQSWYWLEYDETNLFTGGIVGFINPQTKDFGVGQITRVESAKKAVTIRVVPRSMKRNRVPTQYMLLQWGSITCIFEPAHGTKTTD